MTTNLNENRELFFNRLRPVLAPSDLLAVEVAYALSKHAHRWQTRKELDSEGSPIRYFEHLRATALILIDELGIVDPKMIIACLMHDALEDTNDISDRMLEHLFGHEVSLTVKLLTKDPKEGYYARLNTYGNPKVWIVKCCDRLSNLRTLAGCSPEFQKRQINETVAVITPLIDRIKSDKHWAASGGTLGILIRNELNETAYRLANLP
jgi:(p)ppGpp synthase/HD superfamily hydrolase